MNQRITRYFTTGVLAVGIVLLAGCQRETNQQVTDENLVLSGDKKVERTIDAGKQSFVVLGSDALASRISANKVLAANSARGSELLAQLSETTAPASAVATANSDADSLTVGYPVGLLKENQLFGGVITKVSNKTNENLGMLKLSDLTPVHVRTVVAKVGDDQYALALLGCARNCAENSQAVPLVGIPISGVDEAGKFIFLDLSALASDLNLMEFLDPEGEYTGLKTKSAKTVAFDYSVSTLVFDVEVAMVPKNSTEANPPETQFTARWYLRLGSAFNSAFTARSAAEGVGFFMTERTTAPKVQRFALPVQGLEGDVKYYIKNVPTAFRPTFASSFDAWNEQFVALTGRKLLSYEFVEKDDPRHKLLVPGDVRYNIVEWDEDNIAPYGGLGPSIANQFTGQILSANVLIQGPKIVELYSAWISASHDINELRAAGLNVEADELLRKTKLALEAQMGTTKERPKYKLDLGKLSFRISSQTPSLEDPLFQRDDFDEVPAGFTFETYMAGYFHDMLAHELGHNLGLRHNFRGNLGATNPGAVGGVSRSIMEYLGRGFRHLDRLGDYDTMAIKYGYLGTVPEFKDRFCTDEEKADGLALNKSAECSSDDATADPFRFLETRLARAINLLVERNQAAAPTWTVADMDKELVVAIKGMGIYAATAGTTATKWTNFFTGGERPTLSQGPSAVRSYVLTKLRAQLCDPTLATVAATKSTEAAKAKVEQNLAELRARTVAILAPLGTFSSGDLQCN